MMKTNMQVVMNVHKFTVPSSVNASGVQTRPFVG